MCVCVLKTQPPLMQTPFFHKYAEPWWKPSLLWCITPLVHYISFSLILRYKPWLLYLIFFSFFPFSLTGRSQNYISLIQPILLSKEHMFIKIFISLYYPIRHSSTIVHQMDSLLFWAWSDSTLTFIRACSSV